MPEPTYTYDNRVNGGYGGYRNDSTGRFESNQRVRESFDTYINNVSNDRFKAIGQALVDGKISPTDWQLQMRKEILNVNANAAIDVAGGREQMTPAKWGQLGPIAKQQYQYLDNFAEDIASGKQQLNGQFVNRCSMYGGAAETTRDLYDRQKARNSGYDEEKNILEAGAKHCNGCIAETNKGWVPIGSLILIGNRDCLKNDRCTIIYRNTETGEELL